MKARQTILAKTRYAILGLLLLLLTLPGTLQAQNGEPEGKNFGFGLILGEPTGGTIKYWLNNVNTIDADIGGGSFRGSLRLDGDYLWHFYPFNSPVANLYVGPGLALGVGGNDGSVGIRGIVGIDFIPERTPIEIFLHLGPVIWLSPGGSNIDIALGVRFYP